MPYSSVQRWTFFLSGINYKLKYIKVNDNSVADSLILLIDINSEYRVNIKSTLIKFVHHMHNVNSK